MDYRIFRDEQRPKPRGVQAIVQKHPDVGWYVESHGDFYLKQDNGTWQAADMNGLLRYLLQHSLIKPALGTLHEVLVNDEWMQVDVIGFHVWLRTLDNVLTGETIPNVRFQEIFQAALADADFGPKNGYLNGEVRP